ncbi:DUF3859 domain-containing protein [Enterovirga rhinocerotis]|uniref:DUF3859 domain-containing protein n=1 Tax=Enterovirga rhinocerotis TaxID=1339210 RepID=UPI001414EA08|nr:DUF3859 domain-containing protein [Enterovirga rhinocerotis]
MTAEIVDWGVVSGERKAPAPETGDRGLSGARPMRNVRYEERTDRIVAKLCRSFGITVTLSAPTPRQMPRRVEVRVAHPTMTRADGAASSEHRFSSHVIDGETHIGFGFDHDYELQPGAWSISVHARGTEIARKAFTVVLPPPGAPRSECGEVS